MKLNPTTKPNNEATVNKVVVVKHPVKGTRLFTDHDIACRYAAHLGFGTTITVSYMNHLDK